MLSRLTTHTVIWAAARTIGPVLPGFRYDRQQFIASLAESIPDPEKGPDYFAVGDGVLSKHIVVRALDFTALCGLPVTSAGTGDRRDIDCPTCKWLYRRAEKKAEQATEQATEHATEQADPAEKSTGEQVAS